MNSMQDSQVPPRTEGRNTACEGLLRSGFGTGRTRAAAKAMLRLREEASRPFQFRVRSISSLAAAALLLIAAGLWLLQDRGAGSGTGPVASIMEISGDLRNGTAGSLHTGDLIRAGMKLQSGSSSYAKLKLVDGSLVETDEKTLMQINPAGITVHDGRIYCSMEKQPAGRVYTVLAPSGAKAEIVGTGFEFENSSGEGKITLRVEHGAVRLLAPAGRSVMVYALQESSVAGSGAPSLPAAVTGEIAAWRRRDPPARSNLVITPHGPDAGSAFAELRRRGGSRVLYMGKQELRAAVVPADLRFKPVDARTLIESVAAEGRMKVEWVHDGAYAILFTGVSDRELQRLDDDLKSGEPQLRQEAAWRAGWLHDPRVVPLLLRTARNRDPVISGIAAASLERIGLAAVLALDSSAWPLVDSRLQTGGMNVPAELGRFGGMRSLDRLEQLIQTRPQEAAGLLQEIGNVGGDRAFALLERSLSQQNSQSAHLALLEAAGKAGGVKALPLLEQNIAGTNQLYVQGAVLALHYAGNARALELMTGILASETNSSVRQAALRSLGATGSQEALPLIEKVLTEIESRKPRPGDMRETQESLKAIARIGGDRAFDMLEKRLITHPPDAPAGLVDRSVLQVLGQLGGIKALNLLERALSFQDQQHNRYVGIDVARALTTVGGDGAMDLLERILQQQDKMTHEQAIDSLAAIGSERALLLLEKEFNGPFRSRVVIAMGSAASGYSRFPESRTLEIMTQAINDKDRNIRWAAINGLRALGGDKARSVLLSCLAEEKDPTMRIGLTSALSGIEFSPLGIERNQQATGPSSAAPQTNSL